MSAYDRPDDPVMSPGTAGGLAIRLPVMVCQESRLPEYPTALTPEPGGSWPTSAAPVGPLRARTAGCALSRTPRTLSKAMRIKSFSAPLGFVAQPSYTTCPSVDPRLLYTVAPTDSSMPPWMQWAVVARYKVALSLERNMNPAVHWLPTSPSKKYSRMPGRTDASSSAGQALGMISSDPKMPPGPPKHPDRGISKSAMAQRTAQKPVPWRLDIVVALVERRVGRSRRVRMFAPSRL
jgi:hypothetical protein